MLVEKPALRAAFPSTRRPQWAGAHGAHHAAVSGIRRPSTGRRMLGRAGLVFVDGSHAYDYVIADTDTAFRLVADKGMVIWHDYGVWDGVTRALEEIEASRHLGLRHVRGRAWWSGMREAGDRKAIRRRAVAGSSTRTRGR